jgi:hypothetical protein
MPAQLGSGALCSHLTSRGYSCLNQAKDGPFCPGHNPRNQCGQRTTTGAPCQRRAGRDGGPCTKHRLSL